MWHLVQSQIILKETAGSLDLEAKLDYTAWCTIVSITRGTTGKGKS
jgi:hypothetical protein